jgi:hypothetical protein
LLNIQLIFIRQDLDIGTLFLSFSWDLIIKYYNFNFFVNIQIGGSRNRGSVTRRRRGRRRWRRGWKRRRQHRKRRNDQGLFENKIFHSYSNVLKKEYSKFYLFTFGTLNYYANRGWISTFCETHGPSSVVENTEGVDYWVIYFFKTGTSFHKIDSLRAPISCFLREWI